VSLGLVKTNRGELHLDEKLRRYPAGVVRKGLVVVVVVVALSNCRVVACNKALGPLPFK
jgi:hypothetical protein